MNAQTKIEVEGERSTRPTLRDIATENWSAAIRAESNIKRLVWALQGLCNVAEKQGVDVTYWRDLAAEKEADL